MTDLSAKARPLFPGLEGKTFMDSACVSLTPKPAADAVARFLEAAMTCDARDASFHHIAMDQERAVPITEAARLFNVEERRIALIESTTHGLNIAADVIPLQKGDNVLVADTEFLQVPLRWKKLQETVGVEIRPVKAEVPGRYATDDFVRAMDDRTRVACVSTVQWCSGYRIDTPELARVCRDRGIWFVADGIHEAGVMDVDLSDGLVDFYITGGHKWLNAPFGCGVMALSDRVLADLQPRHYGYLALAEPDDGWGEYFRTPDITPYREFVFPAVAKSFEIGGTSNYPGAVGLGQTLKLANDLGIGNIDAHVRRMGDLLREKLDGTRARFVSPEEGKHRAGMTVLKWFDTPAEDQALLEKILDEKIFISIRYTSGVGGIRVSTHYFNNEDDLDRLTDALKRLGKA